MRVATLFVALVLAGLAPAQKVTLPPTPVSGPVGLPFIVRVASLDGDCADWLSLDSRLAILDLGALLPPGTPVRNDTRLVWASEAGTYHLRVVAAKSVNGKAVLSDPADLVITAGTPEPPGPPNPPDDPEAATLTAKLKGAYAAEDAALRARQAAAMADLYRKSSTGSVSARTPGTVFDPAFTTWDELLAAMRAARSKAGIGDADFPHVRGELTAWFNAKFPRQPGTPLDDAGRRLAATEFQRAAKALGSLK